MTARRHLVTLLVGLVVALTVVLTPSTASAHANLLTSDPAANSVVSTAPEQITLTFTESVDVTDDSVQLVDPAGNAVALGPLSQPTDESVVVEINGVLADGTYVVGWSAVSADSHPIGGAFVFSVGAATEIDPAIVDGLASGDSSTWLVRGLGVGRFLSFAGIAVMIGVLAMTLALEPTRLRSRQVGNIVWIGGVAAVTGTAVMISFQAAIIDGSLLDWGTVAGTRSGRWWLLRLFVVAALSVVVTWGHLLAHRWARVAGGVIAVALFAIVAAGGHSVSGRWIVPGVLATVIHLAAMTAWVGGLAVLFLVVDRNQMWATAQRFSPFAVVAVLALAGSGVFNAWRQVAEVDGIGSTTYGRWLLAKLQIVLVVLAAAGLTRLALRRGQITGGARTARVGSVGAAKRAEPEVDHAGEVRRNIGVEIVGILAVLAATAGLANATPPRVLSAGDDQPATTSISRDGYEALIQVDPAATGPVDIVVDVTGDADDAPPDEITVIAELTEAGLGPVEIDVTETAPGQVTSVDATLPVPGTWTFTVTARFGDFDQTVFIADLTID